MAEPFKKQPLRIQQTVGDELRMAREAADLDLPELSSKLNVALKHLEAIEGGRYNDLPSPLYIRKYVQLYCKELHIPWDKLKEKFEREIGVYHGSSTVVDVYGTNKAGRSGVNKGNKKQKRGVSGAQRRPLLIKQVLKVGIFGTVILLLVLYFVWGVVQFLTPPELILSYPDHDIIVHDRTLQVIGRTAPEAIVGINGQGVPVEPDGSFVEEVSLHEGLNTIRVSTRSKRSKERAIIRNILYDSEQKSQ